MKQDVDSVMKYQDKDYYYMREALKEAKKSLDTFDVPVGAILVQNDKIISRAHNKRNKEQNPLKHAEVEAIQKASKKLGTWILDDVTIYVTLEPCTMCAGLILQSRIKRIVFASLEPKHGAIISVNHVFDNPKLNHHPEIVSGILEEESATLLKDFFKNLRESKKR